MPWSGQGEPLRTFRAEGSGWRLQCKRNGAKRFMDRCDSGHDAGLQISRVVRMTDVTVQVCPRGIRLLQRIENSLVYEPYVKKALLRLQDPHAM